MKSQEPRGLEAWSWWVVAGVLLVVGIVLYGVAAVRRPARGAAVREPIQHPGWGAWARPLWRLWAGVGVLLVVVVLVAYGMTADLLRTIPALAFVGSFGILVARVCTPLGNLMKDGLGEVIYRLAASYVPAYLMFALVVDLPRNQDLKKLRPFLASQTVALAKTGPAVLSALTRAADYVPADPPTQEDVVEICQRINPLGKSPMPRRGALYEQVTWMEFLFEHRDRSARTIETLLPYLTYLEPEHKDLIRRIEHSPLFAHLDLLRDAYYDRPLGDTDLSILAQPLFGYYERTRQLQQYADRHFAGIYEGAYPWIPPLPACLALGGGSVLTRPAGVPRRAGLIALVRSPHLGGHGTRITPTPRLAAPWLNVRA